MATWTAVEIHSGDSVKFEGTSDPVLFDTREQVETYLVERFGPEAGMDYAVVEV